MNGVEAYDSGNDGFSTIEGQVMDDEGNIVSESEPEEEEQEVSEEESEEVTEEQEEDEPSEEEPEPVKFEDYKKTAAEKDELYKANIQLQTQLDNLKPILEHPKFKEFFTDQFVNSGTPKEQPMLEFPKDIDLDSMSNDEVLEMTTKVAENRLIAKLEPVFNKLSEQVEVLTGEKATRDNEAFFADKKNEFAVENKDEILNLTKSGLPIQQAYYAVVGPKLKEAGYQQGLTHKSKKGAKDVNLNPKKPSSNSVKNEKMPKDMQDSFAETMRGLGLDPGEYGI